MKKPDGSSAAEGEVFPEGGGHEALFHLVSHEEVEDFGLRHEHYGDIFGGVKMTAPGRSDSGGEEAVGEVGGGAGVAGDRHEVGPHAAGVSRLLLELAAGSLLGGLPFLHDSGAYLVAGAAYAVAVLELHHELTFVGDGDDIDPVGIFEHIEVGIDAAVGKLYGVVAHGEPWGSGDDGLAPEGFPCQRVGGGICVNVVVVHIVGRVGVR